MKPGVFSETTDFAPTVVQNGMPVSCTSETSSCSSRFRAISSPAHSTGVPSRSTSFTEASTALASISSFFLVNGLS